MKRREWLSDMFTAIYSPRIRNFKLSMPLISQRAKNTIITGPKRKLSRVMNLRPQMLHTPHKFIKALQHRRINTRLTAERIGKPQRPEP